MRFVCAFFVVLLGASASAQALEFSRVRSDGTAIISVTGDFEKGDGERFTNYATDEKAIVVLRSTGGNLASALIMGEYIRMRGYATFVPADAICASACALTWLAGVVRGGTETSKIGFHAASEGGGVVTSSGNALIGAYLNKLGISYKAVAYITSSDSADMTWLTFSKARELGIDIISPDRKKAQEPIGLGGRPGNRDAAATTPSLRPLPTGDIRLACVPLAQEGQDPIVAIAVSRIDNFWRIVHIAASGAQYDRGSQYHITRKVGELTWFGQHRRKADTSIRGEVSKLGGKIYYNEKVIGGGELRGDFTARCE